MKVFNKGDRYIGKMCFSFKNVYNHKLVDDKSIEWINIKFLYNFIDMS